LITYLFRRYIHTMQLAHMDIKPGNIFLSYELTNSGDEDGDIKTHYDSADDGFDDDDQMSSSSEVTYKIGENSIMFFGFSFLLLIPIKFIQAILDTLRVYLPLNTKKATVVIYQTKFSRRILVTLLKRIFLH
jgi:serine/threonine protein kinase